MQVNLNISAMTRKLLFGAIGLAGVGAYLYFKKKGTQPNVTGNAQTLNDLVPGGIVQGCTDPNAYNYDPQANYGTPNMCDYPPGTIVGCMNEYASNYNPDATIHNAATCVTINVGCADPAACNYNPDAQFQQAGTCIYPAGVDGGNKNNCNYDAFMGYAGQLTDYSPCITCEDYNDPNYMGPL